MFSAIKPVTRSLMAGLAAAMFLAGCTTTDMVTGERTPNRTANGAIIGALGGAALGTLAGGNDRRNALIGAGVGALAGAAVGNYMDRQYQNLRQRLAGTGVGVTRVNEGQIKLNFPADLTFDFNSDAVKGGFVPTLQNVGGVLSQYPQTTVDVYGFADSVGSDQYNQQLSERRARSVASIFAWTRGLSHRGKLDNNQKLTDYAHLLEKVVVDTVEAGQMTKDLALLVGDQQKWLTTEGYLDAVGDNLDRAMAKAG